MPPEPQDKTFVATHKLKFTISEHHSPLTPASRVSTTASNESQLDPLDGDAHTSRSKDGSGSTPLDGSTIQPHNLKGRIKNWGRNLTHSANQSLRENLPLKLSHLKHSANQPRESLSLNGSHYQSVIIFIPENDDYPIYNLDAKLGKRDGHNSIEFRCSASSDGESSFREIRLDIGLFHLDKARTPIRVIGFYPKVPQLEQTELLNRNGVIFSGQNFEDDSKTTWTWKANDILADGLEDASEFWVTIPSVEKEVEAIFKLNFRVRTNAWDLESYQVESNVSTS